MSESSRSTISRRIAQFSCSFHPDLLRPAHFRQVGRALVDTIGVALAGRTEPVSQAIWRYVCSRPGPTSSGATAWGRGIALAAEEAALYNGVAGHVLDYDDVNSPFRGHPSIALVPPLVALAQARNLDGRRLASAYIVGFEIIVRLGRAMVRDHYAKGWHATTTLGTIGGAVACSHLLGLSEEETVNAIALAVAQAAGTRGNFGTMAKSFQAGHCGASAVRAAILAESGVDGARDVLDGRQGFAKLYGNNEDLGAAFETLGIRGMPGETPYEIDGSGIEIKKYPMCYAAHRSIDGMLDLRAEHGIRASDVAAIHVQANRRALVPLIYDRPYTGLQGKFSLQYAMAAALLDGYVRLSSFTDEAVQRPGAQDLIRRVSCVEDDGPEFPRWNILQLTLKTGAVLCKEVRQLRGSSELPLSDEQLQEKWRDCLEHARLAGEGEVFFGAALEDLDKMSVRDLFSNLPAHA